MSSWTAQRVLDAAAAMEFVPEGATEVRTDDYRLLRHADWAILAKNGTDATTMCCTIARAQTGRSKILVAKGAYHGAAPWCTRYSPACWRWPISARIRARSSDISAASPCETRGGACC